MIGTALGSSLGSELVGGGGGQSYSRANQTTADVHSSSSSTGRRNGTGWVYHQGGIDTGDEIIVNGRRTFNFDDVVNGANAAQSDAFNNIQTASRHLKTESQFRNGVNAIYGQNEIINEFNAYDFAAIRKSPFGDINLSEFFGGDGSENNLINRSVDFGKTSAILQRKPTAIQNRHIARKASLERIRNSRNYAVLTSKVLQITPQRIGGVILSGGDFIWYNGKEITEGKFLTVRSGLNTPDASLTIGQQTIHGATSLDDIAGFSTTGEVGWSTGITLGFEGGRTKSGKAITGWQFGFGRPGSSGSLGENYTTLYLEKVIRSSNFSLGKRRYYAKHHIPLPEKYDAGKIEYIKYNQNE